MVVIAPQVAAAGINAVAGLAGGFLNRNKEAEANKILAQSQAFVAQQNAANNVMGLFGSLGSAQNAQYWGNVLAPDLDVSRQLGAKRTELAELLPKEEARQRENLRWETDFKSSPAFRNFSQQQKISDLKYNPDIIREKAAKTGMFGPIAQAPLGSLTVV
jgi:hypothetical protein